VRCLAHGVPFLAALGWVVALPARWTRAALLPGLRLEWAPEW
jgi:hypothetical protein